MTKCFISSHRCRRCRCKLDTRTFSLIECRLRKQQNTQIFVATKFRSKQNKKQWEQQLAQHKMANGLVECGAHEERPPFGVQN